MPLGFGGFVDPFPLASPWFSPRLRPTLTTSTSPVRCKEGELQQGLSGCGLGVEFIFQS